MWGAMATNQLETSFQCKYLKNLWRYLTWRSRWNTIHQEHPCVSLRHQTNTKRGEGREIDAGRRKRFWTSLWTVLHAVISLWLWVPAPTSAAHRQKWQMELSWSMARQWGELEGLVLRVLEILESRSVDAFPSWGLDIVNMSILGEQQGKQNVRMFASVLTRAYMCGCVCLRVLHRVVESAKQADAAPCAHRCHGSCCPSLLFQCGYC